MIFRVGEASYAVDILRVEEVQRWRPVTRIPNSGDHTLGVINVRGSIIPVVDLRTVLDQGERSYGPTTVIALVRVAREGREQRLGMVVDAVSDVLDIDGEAIRPPPKLTHRGSVYVVGLVPHDDDLVMLIDADRLVEGPEWEISEEIGQ